MVNKCAAYGCKSGYKGHKADERLTFHAFPLYDKELCDRWVKANPRKDYIPSEHSRICSLHFKPSDLLEERTDTNKARLQRMLKSGTERQTKRRLRDDGVPSIFPNALAYLTAKSSGPRDTISTTVSSRREQEVRQLDILEQSFNAADDISSWSLSEIFSTLNAETALPAGFTLTKLDSELLIYMIHVSTGNPVIQTCITLREDLSVTVSLDRKSVPASHFADIVTGPITLMSQVVNLMARVKSWTGDPCAISLKVYVDMAINCLQVGLDNLDDNQSDEYTRI